MMHPALQARLLNAFTGAFGHAPSLVVRAPGRVNLIGEHTDYNDGFVLPCAIDFETRVALSPRDDDRIEVIAADFDAERDAFSIAQTIPHHPAGGWADYVRGVLTMLRAAGMPPRGANIAIAGNVPRGAGLSSSASLEVALALAFRELHELNLDSAAIALLAQQAESRFVGCNCGIMDQMISASGVAGHALLIDCRSLATTPVTIPAGFAIMIVESRIRRGLVESEYNLRRQQCEAAASQMGVPMLRDASLAQLHATALDPVILQRAHHVITENARVLDTVDALAQGDMQRVGELMAASHASMRDDFAITVPAIDHLVTLLQDKIGAQGGARMTGGGFGGCVVALLATDRIASVREHVIEHYRSPEGEPCIVHVCHPAAGAGVTDRTA